MSDAAERRSQERWGGRAAAGLQTPPKPGQGLALGREAATLPRRGPWASWGPRGEGFPPHGAGLAAPLRKSAEKPGGGRRRCSIPGVGGGEALGLVASCGAQLGCAGIQGHLRPCRASEQ